jgi:hypothetical protein
MEAGDYGFDFCEDEVCAVRRGETAPKAFLRNKTAKSQKLK